MLSQTQYLNLNVMILKMRKNLKYYITLLVLTYVHLKSILNTIHKNTFKKKVKHKTQL